MHQDVITRIVICREGFFIFIFIFIFILSILAFSERVPPSSTPTIKYPNGKLWVDVASAVSLGNSPLEFPVFFLQGFDFIIRLP